MEALVEVSFDLYKQTTVTRVDTDRFYYGTCKNQSRPQRNDLTFECDDVVIKHK